MPKIIIICGPSASGKNTIIDSLLNKPEYNFITVVTNTSRPKRPTDVDGKIYNFLSEKEFLSKIKIGFFIEYENTHGYLYGTSRYSFSKPGTYLMQSDIRGALSIKKVYPDILIIFINLPVSQIIKRLEDRGASESSIKTRLETAKREIAMKSKADVIVNNYDGKYKKALDTVQQAIDKYIAIR